MDHMQAAAFPNSVFHYPGGPPARKSFPGSRKPACTVNNRTWKIREWGRGFKKSSKNLINFKEVKTNNQLKL